MKFLFKIGSITILAVIIMSCCGQGFSGRGHLGGKFRHHKYEFFETFNSVTGADNTWAYMNTNTPPVDFDNTDIDMGGGECCKIGEATGYYACGQIDSILNELWLAFKFQTPVVTTAQVVFYVGNNTNNRVELVATSGAGNMWKCASTTGTNEMLADTLYYVFAHVVASTNTDGKIELFVSTTNKRPTVPTVVDTNRVGFISDGTNVTWAGPACNGTTNYIDSIVVSSGPINRIP